jgi:hypothetical protein
MWKGGLEFVKQWNTSIETQNHDKQMQEGRGGGFCRTIKHTKCSLKHKMMNDCESEGFIMQRNTLKAHQNTRWLWTSVREEGVSFEKWQNTLDDQQNTRQWRWHIRKGWSEFCRTTKHTKWQMKNKTTRIINKKGGWDEFYEQCGNTKWPPKHKG